ncbi:transcription factor BHLH148 isoform X2 [Macadamia integrifolia]|uniref:transcription factor BHLH148 isoform X2 n=1 Tax=Macadamia integrifolia TaxID=60698 RepID=UPI001C4F83C9|nr:transcription factor BHLH148 isoform X2 [Macadamia integrifolia]
MDPFFPDELQNPLLWFSPSPPPPPQPQLNQSTFVRYTRPTEGLRSEQNSISNPRNQRNIHKRMIELLRAIATAKNENRELENERSYRHMMNERLRREKQKQSYAALRSMLPPQTKNDKNSIVQMAAAHLQNLKSEKEELRKRNHDVEALILAGNEDKKIRFRVVNPSSPVDSMVVLLKCLKDMNLKVRRIRSEVSAQELSADIEIESLIEAAEVEKAVQKALMIEDEGKFGSGFLEG